jgi:hypothetical protein
VIQKLFIAFVMHPAAPAGVPARRLVDDLASVVIVDQHGNVSMSDWRVDVHGDATYSGGSFRKDEPLPLVIGEVEIIGFAVYLEVQFISPIKTSHGLTPIFTDLFLSVSICADPCP